MKRFLSLAVMVILTTVLAIGQTLTVHGTVTSKTDGEPIIGASVYVTGNSTTGTMTDFDGNFTLDVPQGTESITVSYIGFQTQQLAPQAQMNIVLSEDAEMLEEFVVVGYTVQRKADLTGAVSVMDMKQPTSEGNASMVNSMQGRLPGVNVTTDAAPGGGGSTIRIRGMSTVNSTDPLYVIDGVPTTENLNSLNPSDIESIQVLKDAASASIYGSRAANGVIIITTKRGKGDRLTVNVGYSASMQTIAQKYDLLDAAQWGKVYLQATSNDGSMPSILLYDASGNLNATANGYTLANNDWQDAIYRTAWTHNTSASVSNSGEKGTMMLSLNYINQDGIQKETFYQRFSARVNSTYNINKWFSVGENLMVAKWMQNYDSSRGDRGIASLAMLQHPGIPTYQPDGKFSSPMLIASSDYANPMQSLWNARDNSNENWRIFGNAYAEWKPVKGLTLKSNIGIEHIQFNSSSLGRKALETDENSVSRSYGQGDTWTWTNTATYVGNWGKHNLVGLAGVEAIGYKYDGMSANRKGFAFEDVNYMVLDAGEGTQTNGGGKSEWALFSYFFKADYNYADRYLASFTIRRDATSRLYKDNNSGIFPAFTAAWRPTAEAFWPENDFLSDFKIRFGWGQNGNSAISNNYAYWSTYAYDAGNSSYDLNGTNTNVTTGIKVATTGNKDLKWETTTQTNVGVDAQFFRGALSLSADWYVKKTTDMITIPPVLSVAGENAATYRNTGDMKNSGFELTLGYHSPEYGGFSWDASLNVAKYKNEVVKLSDNVSYIGSEIRLMEGEPMGVYYGYVTDGIFQTQDEVDNYAVQQGKGVGRIKYRDLDGNGIINESDQCIIGDPNPDWTGGLNLDFHYKGLTLSTFFTGEFGFDIFNSNKRQLEFMSSGNTYTNRGADILEAWTSNNPSATIPAVSFSDNNDEKRMSTYFVEDGSYVKMKYIKLSYDLQPKLCKYISASSLNVFAQLENVFTITDYTGLDPELNLGGYGCREDNGAYPRSRTFSLGVNVTF
ncbi:MAG: TonB-dependent receptor [Bacteroidales bacterium]|nr:TonB-dependent receptor [Bacteroidales bacterium]